LEFDLAGEGIDLSKAQRVDARLYAGSAPSPRAPTRVEVPAAPTRLDPPAGDGPAADGGP
jgi:hypothetical protein